MRFFRHPGALGVLGCSLAIGACGSSSNTRTDPASHGFQAALRFSACMRSHGVPNFPDPSTTGNAIRIRIDAGSGANPFSPAFKAAQAQCGKLLPKGQPGGGPPSAQAKAQMLATSTCMRAHGITDFPDPTTTPPSQGSAGVDSAVLGRGGVFLVIPSTINLNSPAFQHAAAECGFGPRKR